MKSWIVEGTGEGLGICLLPERSLLCSSEVTFLPMQEILFALAFLAFLCFLFPSRFKAYFAISGWTGVVLLLVTEVPYFLSISNILYPFLAVIALPFLWWTARHLLAGEAAAISLSRAAAVAFLIYAPFEFIPALGQWLIGVVVGQVYWLLSAFGISTSLLSGNIIARNGFRVEIILACTGIQGIAIMLGVASAVETTLTQKVMAFLAIVLTIYPLNLLRNIGVIAAYTGQWFQYLPEIAGNGELGYESFFWAHNIIAEGVALAFLVLIALYLFRLIPPLSDLAGRLYDLYYHDLTQALGVVRGRGMP